MNGLQTRSDYLVATWFLNISVTVWSHGLDLQKFREVHGTVLFCTASLVKLHKSFSSSLVRLRMLHAKILVAYRVSSVSSSSDKT